MSQIQDPPYQAKLDFDSTHTRAVAAVPAGCRVLDIGCANGYLAAALKEKGCRVDGVDRRPGGASSDLDAFFEADLNAGPLPVEAGAYDRVLILDVVEHLLDPESFVLAVAESIGGKGKTEVIATTGNVAFIAVRLMLLFGAFEYGERGILDRTHTRLFTFSSFRKLFEDAGFEILETKGIPAPFPLVVGNNAFGRSLTAINRLLIAVSRGLFSYQIFFRLREK